MASTLGSNLFFFFLLLFPLCAVSQNITVGASLAADESSKPWLSPSGDFAFGFIQLPANKDLFLLSIWFDKIPEKTIIWYQNGNNPVPRGSKFWLVAAGGLQLRDPQDRFIWSTDLSPGRIIAYGFLNDTGNLVIFGSDSTRLWESFKNPTDTIVPSQTIEINGMLISRKSETNFSQGRFYARMLDNGNFVFSTKSVPSNTDFDDDYYTSSTSDVNASNSGYQVVFNEKGSLIVRRRNGEQSDLSALSIPPASENYYRATLNFDGVFIQYYHPKNGNPGWNVAGYWPNNICLSVAGQKGSGACGYNNVCLLQSGRPNCRCPERFSLADPNDLYGDCEPDALSNCVEGEKGSPVDIFELVEIQDTDWPFNDYSQKAPSTEEDCRSSCLNDCFCGVAIYRSNSCWKKRLPLSNGRINLDLNVKAFFKFRTSDIPLSNPNISTPSTAKKDQKTLILVGSVLLGSSALVNFLFISAVCLFIFLKHNKKISNLNPTLGGSNLRCFTYADLEQATSGFREELGSGSFGTVYKGVLRDPSKTIVAVKKLERVAKDSEKEFRAEVDVIGHTHHKNLVRLLGFCDEGPNRLLVYEYMSNGTLADFLFCEKKPSWIQRTQMAIGVARGLTYLHEECSKQIIHCDIKPQNILLDEYYNTRISDFGLAKLLLMDQSRTLTNVRGTKGYLAPEWFRNTQITVKVDVYSFGVLLLEIVSCRRSLEDLESGGELSVLTDLAWDCYTEGKLDILVENDTEALDDFKRVERFLKVALWCIQEESSLRPSMKKACQMLEGIVEVEDPRFPSPLTALS